MTSLQHIPPKGTADTIPRKPPSNILKGYALKEQSAFLSTISDRHIVRDNFTISTWLLLGASLQCLLLALPLRPSYAVLPALLLLGYRFINGLLMCFGTINHPYADGVIPSKTVTVYPESANINGERKVSDGGICVIMLFARCNQYVLEYLLCYPLLSFLSLYPPPNPCSLTLADSFVLVIL
jgi:hypothetical protein